MKTVTAGHRPRAHPLRRPVRRARQPLPAPGRPARRGHDREGPAALPVARLRLLPADRRLAERVRRRRADATRSRSATTASTSGVEPDAPHVRTVSDVMAETMVAWGVTHVFGMVGHSNLGLADAMRRQRGGRRADVHRHPPRGRRGVRGLGLRQAHRPPGGVPDDRRPGRHQPAHRPVGRQGRPRAGARAHRPGRHRRCSARAPSRRSTSRRRSARSRRSARPCCPRARHAELMALAVKHALLTPRRRAPRLPRRGPDPPGARRRRPARPRAAWRRRGSRRRRERARRARSALLARREAPGDRRRPRRALRHGPRSSRSPSASARRSSRRSRPRA